MSRFQRGKLNIWNPGFTALEFRALLTCEKSSVAMTQKGVFKSYGVVAAECRQHHML